MEPRIVTIRPEPERTEQEIQDAYKELIFRYPDADGIDNYLAEGYCGLCGSLCFQPESIGQPCASCTSGAYLKKISELINSN